MKLWSISFAILIAASMGVANFGVAQDKGKVASKDEMTKKLEYSKNILAGLSTENFELITANAEALNELGKKRWLENESSEYRTQHQVFWFSNESLIDAAKDKNIDGATLAYTQMTFSCVNCHKVIRRR